MPASAAPAAPAAVATAADPERAKQLSQAVAEQVRSLAERNKIQDFFFFTYFKTKNLIHEISGGRNSRCSF